MTGCLHSLTRLYIIQRHRLYRGVLLFQHAISFHGSRESAAFGVGGGAILYVEFLHNQSVQLQSPDILTVKISRHRFVKKSYNKVHKDPRKGLGDDCHTTSQPAD